MIAKDVIAPPQPIKYEPNELNLTVKAIKSSFFFYNNFHAETISFQSREISLGI